MPNIISTTVDKDIIVVIHLGYMPNIISTTVDGRRFPVRNMRLYA